MLGLRDITNNVYLQKLQMIIRQIFEIKLVRILIAFGVIIGYFLISIQFSSPVGYVTILSIIPIIVVGLLFGMRLGLLFGLLSFVLNSFFVLFIWGYIWNPFIFYLGHIFLVFVGGIVGHTYETLLKLRQEVAKRIELEGDWQMSEAKYRNLWQGSTEGIALHTVCFVDCNRRFAQILV